MLVEAKEQIEKDMQKEDTKENEEKEDNNFFCLGSQPSHLLSTYFPTSMLSIIILTMRLGVTLNVSEVPYVRIDTATWRHFPRHLVWFSHAFPLDSFSRTARTRSHVQC